jgi:hypothetical protein
MDVCGACEMPLFDEVEEPPLKRQRVGRPDRPDLPPDAASSLT